MNADPGIGFPTPAERDALFNDRAHKLAIGALNMPKPVHITLDVFERLLVDHSEETTLLQKTLIFFEGSGKRQVAHFRLIDDFFNVSPPQSIANGRKAIFAIPLPFRQ